VTLQWSQYLTALAVTNESFLVLTASDEELAVGREADAVDEVAVVLKGVLPLDWWAFEPVHQEVFSSRDDPMMLKKKSWPINEMEMVYVDWQ